MNHKKPAFYVRSVFLVALAFVLMLTCSSCKTNLLIHLVDQNGNELGSSANQSTEPTEEMPVDAQTAAVQPAESQGSGNMETSEKANKIACQVGQEVTIDDFTFTLTKIEFTRNVPFEHVSTYYYPVQDHAAAKEGYTWLSYYVDLTFHGRNNVLGRNAFFPSVQYGDTYDWFVSNYFTEKCVDGKWGGLRSNFEKAPYYGVDDYDFMYDPYVDHTYSLHGAIEVPIKAVDDKASSLVLELYIPSEMDTIPDAPSLSIATGTGKYARFDVRSVQ